MVDRATGYFLHIHIYVNNHLKKKKIMCLICSLVWWDSFKKGFYKIKLGFCETTHILQLTLFLLVKQLIRPSPKLLEFMDLNRLVRMKSIWLMTEPLNFLFFIYLLCTMFGVFDFERWFLERFDTTDPKFGIGPQYGLRMLRIRIS